MTARAADKDFVTVANAYVEDMLKTNPETATLLGDHRYDDRLPDPKMQAHEWELQMLQEFLGLREAVAAGDGLAAQLHLNAVSRQI